ncbi:glucose-fructose oxidoreductase [Pseudoxanthomonas broegbernensis]|uniref:Glucose-fructose oxidoreductase n=1 Tax=Pseudoxanthomonas broegbernensis TaxID=83619 RepID=A0A7V8GMR4_9GAMM|nr:Gfo/Idh/MocA family oxidoreductase [Pseudoxanthomonas broegbernensis]KAF1686553.1 glucose-fructose oxidoreductase [Pseudoxanthomonas broegbernensis]MBB6064223.1 glucose-fructose oxidoreductase [Pseudoxanthomonas broegbernensis]
MQLQGITRRHLLAAMAGAGLGAALPVRAGTSTQSPPPAPRRQDSIGVALVGLGYYASHLLAPGLQLTRNCHLAGIVTSSPEKVPAWQERHGIPDRNVYDYDGFDRIADNPDIQAVYIATPNDLHLPLTRRAAAAGKHVWCEKPMAMNAAEGEAMIEACRRNKVQLAIGYRLQHESNTRRLMAMARDKPYGKILKVRADAGFHAYDDVDPAAKPWRLLPQHGGGAMYDMGVYALNAARYTTAQEPVAVTARQEIHRPHLFEGVDETMYFTLEFGDGLVAECATSFGKEMNTLRIDCERGWYEMAPFQTYDGLKGRTSDGQVFTDTGVSPYQQARQMDDDALAILQGTAPLVPGEEGLRDMRVLDAVYASARGGGRRIVLA